MTGGTSQKQTGSLSFHEQEIRSQLKRSRTAAADAGQAIWQAGFHMATVQKEDLFRKSHGSFGTWVKETYGISLATAQTYMKVASLDRELAGGHLWVLAGLKEAGQAPEVLREALGKASDQGASAGQLAKGRAAGQKVLQAGGSVKEAQDKVLEVALSEDDGEDKPGGKKTQPILAQAKSKMASLLLKMSMSRGQIGKEQLPLLEEVLSINRSLLAQLEAVKAELMEGPRTMEPEARSERASAEGAKTEAQAGPVDVEVEVDEPFSKEDLEKGAAAGWTKEQIDRLRALAGPRPHPKHKADGDIEPPYEPPEGPPLREPLPPPQMNWETL